MIEAVCGSELPIEECVLLTAGRHEGEYCEQGEEVELTHGDSEGLIAWENDPELIDEGGNYWLKGDGLVTDWQGEVQSEDECMQVSCGNYDGEWCLVDDLARTECGYYRWPEGSRLPDQVVEIGGTYYDREDCSFCDDCQEYYVDESCPDCPDSAADRINAYHNSPSVTLYGYSTKSIRSRYSIGFEVEKTEVEGETEEGEPITETYFFAGWETDSSCGVEGISNVYSFGDEGRRLFMAHVSDDDAREQLGEPVDASCGGHVNFSGPGVTLASVRPYAGLFYALYKGRLNNRYSSDDKSMKGGGPRYSAIREKRNGLVEFRLVSAVKNAEQVVWRYELFALLAEAMEKGLSFRGFWHSCYPHLRKVYSRERIGELRQNAFSFNRYLMQGIIENRVDKYL